MTVRTAPLASSESSAPSRIFGARPFHTDGELLALHFAADGGLWSVEEPGVLRHWDVAGRRQLAWHELGAASAVWAFSPSVHYVASGGDELCLWLTAGGEAAACWPQPSWVTALAFQPGGLLLASGHDDGGVRLWHHGSRRLAYELRPPARPSGGAGDTAVSALAFSPDGRRLAVAAEDRTIVLWDVARCEPLGELVGHRDRIPALAWHRDGRRLISAGWDTTARVWDTTTGLPLILLNSHAGQVQALALAPDGQTLACADSESAVHLWDADAYRTRAVCRDHAGEVRCLAFSRDGRLLASGGGDGVIHVGDACQPAAQAWEEDSLACAAGWQGARTCLAVSPDGRRLAGLGAGTALRVWDTATGEPCLRLEDDPLLRAFSASPDGRWVAGSVARPEGPEPDRGTLFLWDAETGRRHGCFAGQAAPVTALAFSPDSSRLAAAGPRAGDVWLWTVHDGQPLLLPDVVAGCGVEALAFDPTGRLLAVAGVDWLGARGAEGRIVLWDLEQHRPAAVLPGAAVGLAFHPSVRLLAAAALSAGVALWDVPDGRPCGELTGHLGAVTCVAFSPDGRRLASGGDDRTVRLWDAESGAACGLVELDTQVKALAFAPDGQALYTGNGTASCYQLRIGQLLPR